MKNYRTYKKLYLKNIELKKELNYIKDLYLLKVINKEIYLKHFIKTLNKINKNNIELLKIN